MVSKKRINTKNSIIKRKSSRRKNNGGHPFLLLLFFIAVVFAAAFTVNNPFREAASPEVSANTTIHHIFDNDKGKNSDGEENVESGKGKEKSVSSVIEKIMNTIKGGEKRPEVANDTEKQEKSIKETENIVEKPLIDKGEAVQKDSPAEYKKKVTGRLAVIIDDAGLDLESQRIYQDIGVPFTLAVMPNKLHTAEAAAEWASHGMPVILHQPMEPMSDSGMEDKTILTSMGDGEIRNMLSESLSQVPQAVGINNHQGSKATTDYRVMSVVMKELSRRGLFFFDSRTNTTTAADRAASASGVPYVRNDLFVDNSTDEGEIRAMIREGAERAKARGTYIIIGHCRPHTAAAFRDMVPQLKAEGIEFIYVSSLVQ